MLSRQEIDTIKAFVPVLEQYGNTVTQVFYKTLLKDYPSLNEVFNQGNQATGHQAKALAEAVHAYAQNIDNQGALSSVIDHITQKHASLFIQPEQYAVVGKYLLDAFAQVLGSAFTPAIKSAWASAYAQLAELMISAEKKLYEAAEGWTSWRNFVIRDKIRESTEITSFILVPADNDPLPTYLPGQYVSLRVEVPRLVGHQARQYSLSDKPARDHYRISVRKDAGLDTSDLQAPAHPGYVSNVLHDDEHIGDVVQLSRPVGVFFLNPDRVDQAPVVLLSAGVGLTPLLSMLNTLLGSSHAGPITWVHGARNTRARAFTNDIRKYNELQPQFHTIMFVKNPSKDDVPGVDYQYEGRVDLEKCDKVRELFATNKLAEYYICGPPSFMSDMQTKLRKYGVDRSRIKMERFGTGGLSPAH